MRSVRSCSARLVGLLVVPLAGGCEKSDEVSWTQFNSDDNVVTVEVGAAEVLPAVEVLLTSNTGEVDIGVGSVDPGGGPINTTTYQVRVDIAEEYADDVGRVSVRTNSGDRGEDEYDLYADTTGQGIWVFELVALGDEGETRSDTLTFRLWQADDSAEE